MPLQNLRRGSNPNLDELDLDMADVASDNLDGNGGTLNNILNITESQDAILSYCFHDEDGRIVTRSIFNISDTDPVDIVGQEVVMANPSLEEEESGAQQVYDSF